MLDEKALKYYRALRIPSYLSRLSKYVYMFVLIVLLLIYTLFWYFNRVGLEEALLTSIIHVALFIVFPLYLKLVIRYMKTRQYINMMLFLLAPGIPLEMFGASIGVYGLAYVVIPLLGVIALRSFTGSRYQSFTVIVFTLVAELLFMVFTDKFTPHRIIVRTITSVLPIAVSLYFMRKVSSSYKELDVFKMANAWIKSMLLSIDEEFSSILDSIGQEADINAHVILFKTKSKKLAYIVPEVHFGPFRNVGSSALPHIFDQITRHTEVIPLVFHSTGSHERNLVSINESQRYAEEVVRKAESMEGFAEDIMYKPFRVHSNHFEAFVLQTNLSSFIAISSPVIGNDDIPFGVQLRALELGKMYGLKDVAIIDCHNVEGKPIGSLDEYESIILSSLSRNTGICRELGIGYGEAYVKGYVNGLCSNKVKASTIKCDNLMYAIVYLYGNNATVGVREALRRLAIDMGYSDVEVFTADDHTCSGITFKEPYQAVELNTHLIKAVELALNMSMNSIESSKVYSTVITVKSKIVGSKIFDLLELAKLISHRIIRYIFISYFLIYILTLVLCFTIISLC